MPNTLHVFRKILKNGVEVKIKQKKYKIVYPTSIWEKLPKSLHRMFADGITYASTWHLPFITDGNVAYHFSHPPIEPVFFKILLYCMPTNIFEYTNVLTSELIKKFYNVNFLTQYKGLNHAYSGKKIKRVLKEKAIVLFSFGKESLLTYGLLEELGVKTELIFMKEPQSIVENNHKKKLTEKFYVTFKKKVAFFPLPIGKLREASGFYWGWDIILSQYAFFLLPYYFFYHAKYLFFGNENSCNFHLVDKEGYRINPVFEQSVSSMQFLQDIPKLFFINTHIGSLVEPIHEIFITYILHHRYPEVGAFQMSCFSDDEIKASRKKRWCGECEKCARLYIFFKALGISPNKTGLTSTQMLSLKKGDLYPLFNKGEGKSLYGGSGLGRDEQLLAFYLAYKNGAKGELMEKFRLLYLPEAERKKEKLIKKYFGIYSSYSLPSMLKRKIIRIFQKEQQKAFLYIDTILNSSNAH